MALASACQHAFVDVCVVERAGGTEGGDNDDQQDSLPHGGLRVSWVGRMFRRWQASCSIGFLTARARAVVPEYLMPRRHSIGGKLAIGSPRGGCHVLDMLAILAADTRFMVLMRKPHNSHVDEFSSGDRECMVSGPAGRPSKTRDKHASPQHDSALLGGQSIQ